MVKGVKGLSDPRFAHLKSDPKFGGLKRKERKVVLEDRFAGALTDSRFTRAPLVDKRGRKVKRTGDATLHRLYEVEEKKQKEDEEKEEEEEEEEEVEVGSEEEEGSEEESQDENEGEEEEEDDDADAPVKYDLARGDGEYVSSSSEEEEEEEEEWELDKAEVDHDWGNLDKDARRVEWASRRLAICNLDWDSLSSEDLFLLVSSFKPLGGQVESLSIYLSDMGKEKLEKEEKEGPQLVVNENGEDGSDDDDDDDDGRLDEETLKHHDKKREAIRKYQMERLKYFYAVLVCDSEQTASAVYENCDGVEYENSGLRLDLRFVPDDMTFDEDRLKERVTADDVDSSKYKPKEISNVAAATTKVKLTWEDSDVNRSKKMRGAFDEDADLDAVSRDLIAPSSGEESAEEEEDCKEKILTKKERLAILLGGGDKEEEDMEVEWEKEEEDEKEEKKIKKKSKSSWEQYLEKRKAKRKEKKTMAKEERRKAKEERDQEEEERRMDKKKVVKKEDKKAKDVGDVQVDPRFNALFTDSAFSIDTTSNLNKNKGLVEKQNAARRKRKAETEMDVPSQGGHDTLIAKLKNKSAKWSS